MNRSSAPLVSCLMVTRDRPRHAVMAARAFLRQTHPACELVVVDDGHVDYAPFLPAGTDHGVIRYHRLADGRARTLGEMRNLSLELAAGDWWIQWDDDEWYHPDRIATQLAAATRADATGSLLRWTLMHVDTPRYAGRPFRADAGFATPGTILHRRTDLRYPAASRGEDSSFLTDARRRGALVVLGREQSHLFVRCFHGANTWDERHFLRRLRRRPADWPSWVSGVVRGDLTGHRAFRLDPREQAAADALRTDLAALEALDITATEVGR